MLTQIVTVGLSEGVHARPAAELVRISNLYPCRIELYTRETVVDAKSVLSIMKLAIRRGAEVTVTTDGESEAEALREITRLLAGENNRESERMAESKSVD